MGVDMVLAGKIVDFLNELLERDRMAVWALFAHLIPCSAEMAEHPTVQVATQNGGYHVGWLGILNGLCGHDGTPGPIVAIFKENPGNTGGHDLIGFELSSIERG